MTAGYRDVTACGALLRVRVRKSDLAERGVDRSHLGRKEEGERRGAKIPENVSDKDLATVTAGFAKDVDAVNQ